MSTKVFFLKKFSYNFPWRLVTCTLKMPLAEYQYRIWIVRYLILSIFSFKHDTVRRSKWISWEYFRLLPHYILQHDLMLCMILSLTLYPKPILVVSYRKSRTVIVTVRSSFLRQRTNNAWRSRSLLQQIKY